VFQAERNLLLPDFLPVQKRLDYANASSSNTSSNNPYATLTITPNMIAAGGPIPPNYTLAQQEENAPWYPTLLSYEHHDTNRSKLYESATFTGSFTGPNEVYAYQSPDIYYTPFMIATRGINEMYVYGGASYNAVPTPSGSFVARAMNKDHFSDHNHLSIIYSKYNI